MFFRKAVFAESQPSVGSFDDAIDITALSAIQTKLEEILNLLKCGREVFGDAIAESGLKGEFQQFKLQVDKIIKNELPLCRSAGNIGDKYKCVNYWNFIRLYCQELIVMIYFFLLLTVVY